MLAAGKGWAHVKDSSAEQEFPTTLIEQVIGQEHAVGVVRLAARQRRFVLLVGEPGTGKSLLGRAIAELLPPVDAYCVASLANPADPSCPRIVCCPRAEWEAAQQERRLQEKREHFSHNYLLGLAALGIILVCGWLIARDQAYGFGLAGLFSLIWLWRQRKVSGSPSSRGQTKILVERKAGAAPFIDATACNEGALFGDVRHDPYQSGGGESPPHLLVEPGAVHRAHGGVLYIDEIGNLSADAQKLLLTAIQDKALPITGRQSGSSGTLIRTEAIPCDFMLVAAGNKEDMTHIIPALRSRILGYGFEVLTASTMADTPEHRRDLERFVAQEVNKDGRIPHFTAEALTVIVDEARRRAARPGRLTTRLRELGGLVRIAGDLAVQDGQSWVLAAHVRTAQRYATSIEEQQAQQQQSEESTNGWKPELPARLLHSFPEAWRPMSPSHHNVDQ
jgi:Lon-like ATP-dependent protease